jgi:nucleoside-diphosphate-sugar epimerase
MRIAITGATGFVGCRLAERIVLDGRHEAVGVVRRYSGPGLARLARLPVRLAPADLRDERALRAAFDGCDAVVHCAYGTAGPPEERYRVTVEGTAAVLRAATEAGTRKLVHLSSWVVHGPPASGTIDESTPLARPRENYDRMKVDAERVVWEHHRTTGFPVVVLRPPLIYGPHGRGFTVRILEQIRSGAALVDGGAGTANFLYVDNLADLILAVLETDAGDGRAFVAVDPAPATWRDVYEGYHGILPGAPPLASLSRPEALRALRRANPGALYRSVVLPFRLAPQLAAGALSAREVRRKLRSVPWVEAAARLAPERMAARLKPGGGTDGRAAPEGAGGKSAGGGRAGDLPVGLDRRFLDLLCTTARCDASAAEAAYGHRPRVTFEAALEKIAAWARYQRIHGATDA